MTATPAIQNASGLLPTTCAECGHDYFPAFRPTSGAPVCSLCALRAEIQGERL